MKKVTNSYIVFPNNRTFRILFYMLLALLILLFVYFILTIFFSSIISMIEEMSTFKIKFDYKNPAFITTPIATLTAAIVTLLSILLVAFQMQHQRKLNSNSAITEFHKQFESREMLIHRARLSKFLLERKNMPRPEYKALSLNQDQVIQFFETISLLTLEGNFDQEMICREFSLEMLNYYYFLSGLMDSDNPIPSDDLPTPNSLISETEKAYYYSPEFFYPNFVILCKKFEETYDNNNWRSPNFTFEKKKDMARVFLKLETERYKLEDELKHS